MCKCSFSIKIVAPDFTGFNLALLSHSEELLEKLDGVAISPLGGDRDGTSRSARRALQCIVSIRVLPAAIPITRTTGC